MRMAAVEFNVPLIDLNLMSKTFYEALGPENSKKAFVHYPANTYPGQDKPLADNTHFSVYGVNELAKCVVQGIKDNQMDLGKYISDDFDRFDPLQPDSFKQFTWSESLRSLITKPEGN